MSPTQRNNPHPGSQAQSPKPANQPRGLLAGMRIRKKLMFLHTLFSIVLAVVLVVALHPAITSIVLDSQSRRLIDLLTLNAQTQSIDAPIQISDSGILIEPVAAEDVTNELAAALAESPGPVVTQRTIDRIEVLELNPDSGQVLRAVLISSEAHEALRFVHLIIILAVLGVYAIVAASLELFVLPKHVYAPIDAALRADEAIQSGDHAGELIPPELMPADELGAIMRSRNQSISELRAGQAQLAETLDRFESVATDLRRKNHLLENARKNLEGADRLRSLGMMSAGIAHEINTPLAVAKGLVEKFQEQSTLSESETKLLARVISRLETLSESLLDFARARSLEPVPAKLFQIAQEATALVRLDRNTMPKSDSIQLVNQVPEDLTLECEPDRIIQVLVNLVRNAVNAIRSSVGEQGLVTLSAQTTDRDGQRWIQLTITDNGPGIDPKILPDLFEPFVSTRLDARGTGLGLAVAEGIVGEHGGTIIASNRPGRSGAMFEVMLPQTAAKLGVENDHA